jgi:hypothetical protein
MSFTEQTKAMLRSEGHKLQDGWVDYSGGVKMREPLNIFHLHTNNSEVAKILLNDPEVFNIFKGFINFDSRGHPMMSLEVLDGVITLRFHSQGALEPNLLDLRSNVTTIENYFDRIVTLENKLMSLI